MKRVCLFLLLIFLFGAVSCTRDQKPSVVRMGSIHSLTSWGAAAGKAEHNAILMAVEDINQAGGIAGRELKIIAEDNQSDFRATAAAFSKLADQEKLPVVLGPNWSEFSEVAAPRAEESQVVMITASGYSPTLAAGKEYVFSLLPNYEVVTKPLADYIAKRDFNRIAAVVVDNAYFEGLHAALKKHLLGMGKELWKEINTKPELGDYRTIIAQLRKNKVDAVIMLLSENGENASFLRQAREQNFSVAVFSSNALAYDSIVVQDWSVANGVIFFEFVTKAPESFLERYRQRFREAPYFSAPQAYDSVFLVKRAMEECGLSSVEVRKCLSKIDYQGLSGRIRFDSDGNITGGGKITALHQVRDGIIQPLGQ